MAVSHLEVYSALDALLDRCTPAVGLCEASRLTRDADVSAHSSDLPGRNDRSFLGARR